MTQRIPEFERHAYRKSSFSTEDNPQCVEIARTSDMVGVRDSKTAFGTTNDIRFAVPAAQFDSLIAGIQGGRFA